MSTSKRQKYERLYKVARRKLDNNIPNEGESESDENENIPLNTSLSLQFNETIDTNLPDNDIPVSRLDVDASININRQTDFSEPLSDDECFTKHAQTYQTQYEDSSETESESISDQLREWTTKYNISHNATDALLKILKGKIQDNLPLTARSLLHTRLSIETEQKSGMEYFYFGIEEQLIKYLNMAQIAGKEIPQEIQLSLNIDGLPLFRSSKKSLWPILGLISNITPSVVFPIAITCGDGKPHNLDFLHNTITDLNSIFTNGLSFQGRRISVLLQCVICDAPARSLVKCTKLYSGYYWCDKCDQKGNYVDGKVVFPEHKNFQTRTDLSFRSQINKEHHHAFSPFCELPIDMIINFPNDYMHQSCLGVMKKLLLAWIKGPRNNRISTNQKDIISGRLIQLKSVIPSLFARKPRSLDEIDYWKATEFRQFLLYTGRIVLKGVLDQNLYHNFIHLSLALCIMVSKRLNQRFSNKAEELLATFLSDATDIYGETFMVYNVHQLSHLCAEANEFECLDMFSAFPYENYLQTLKKNIRSSRRPLIQTVKRILENESIHNRYQIASKTSQGQFSKKDAFILNDGIVCEVIEKSDNTTRTVQCHVYSQTYPAYLEPMDSTCLNIYRVNLHKHKTKYIDKTCLTRRAIIFPVGNNEFEFVEVLHNE